MRGKISERESAFLPIVNAGFVVTIACHMESDDRYYIRYVENARILYANRKKAWN